MNSYKLELCTRTRYFQMLWKRPVYEFRVPTSAESSILKEVKFDVTGSAPRWLEVEDIMRGVWERFLESEEGKRIKTVLDFGAGKFRNTLYFLNQGKKVTAVEFEELSKRSKDASSILEICEQDSNFQHLVFPFPFLENSQQFDLCLLVNVIPVMPVFAERMILLDLLYDRINKSRYVIWYAQKEGTTYKKIREAGKNNCGDGIWMGTQKKFKTFYRYHSVEEVKEMFALYGFEFLRKITASGSDVLLFEKIDYNLLHNIITPKRIIDAIPRNENIVKPEGVKLKRMRETNEMIAIIPNPVCLSISRLYSEALKAIPTGNGTMPEEYHRLISQIILRIFRTSLRNMQIKVDLNHGLKIIDTVYSNYGGLISEIAKKHDISCNYVVLEAKNYSFELGNTEFDQISGRLKDEVGKLGLLVCRNATKIEDVNSHCQDIFEDNKKHVIVLTDKEVLYLLDLSIDSDEDSISDFMDSKIRSIKFKSKK